MGHRIKSAWAPRLTLLPTALAIIFSARVAQATLAGDRDAAQDFAGEARILYRVVACGGGTALPANINPQVVAKHCQLLKGRMERYRRLYLARAKPFLATLRPPNLPDKVVYPFGEVIYCPP